MTITSQDRERILEITRYAAKPPNYFSRDKAKEGILPGADPHLVADIDSHHCVFSFTVRDDNNLYRHLSVSHIKRGKRHLPEAADMAQLAWAFGFNLIKHHTAAVNQKAGIYMVLQLVTPPEA